MSDKRIKDMPELQEELRKQYAPGMDKDWVWNDEEKGLISTCWNTDSFLWRYRNTAIDDLTPGQIDDIAGELNNPKMVSCFANVQELYNQRSIRESENVGLSVLSGLLDIQKQRQSVTLRDLVMGADADMKKRKISADPNMTVESLFKVY